MKSETAHTESLPLELFEKIKAIQIHTQHVVNDLLAGNYESAFKGRGMEFAEVREYLPGDDIRHIDWNVSARMNAPFIKSFHEERELTVMLLVDVSASGAFGSAHKLKNELAAEIAAVLAYTAIKSNDRVGLIIFSDKIEHFIPPKKGRAHVWRVIREILAFKPEERATNISLAVDFLAKVLHRRSVVFMISDFLNETLSQNLRVMARKHDLNAIQIYDQREQEMPNLGILELEDAETGEVVLIDTESASFRKGFARNAQTTQEEQSNFFRSAGIAHLPIATHEDLVDPIIRFFRAHHR